MVIVKTVEFYWAPCCYQSKARPTIRRLLSAQEQFLGSLAVKFIESVQHEGDFLLAGQSLGEVERFLFNLDLFIYKVRDDGCKPQESLEALPKEEPCGN